MLQAIAASFGPMALYISADYFEHQLSSLPIERHGSMIETIRNATSCSWMIGELSMVMPEQGARP